jgi:hypothetical protein
VLPIPSKLDSGIESIHLEIFLPYKWGILFTEVIKMRELKIGQRVELNGFGEGTVVSCSNELGEVEVAFSEMETMRIAAEELNKLE